MNWLKNLLKNHERNASSENAGSTSECDHHWYPLPAGYFYCTKCNKRRDEFIVEDICKPVKFIGSEIFNLRGTLPERELHKSVIGDLTFGDMHASQIVSVQLAGEHRIAGAVEPLLKLLSKCERNCYFSASPDSRDDMETAIVRALGKIGSRNAITALSIKLGRMDAVIALARAAAYPEIYAYLRAFPNDKHDSKGFTTPFKSYYSDYMHSGLSYAVSVVSVCVPDAACIDFAPYLAHGNPDVRMAAVQALHRRGNRDWILHFNGDYVNDLHALVTIPIKCPCRLAAMKMHLLDDVLKRDAPNTYQRLNSEIEVLGSLLGYA